MSKRKAPEVTYVFNASLVRLVDGDTLRVAVDRFFSDSTRMNVRIYRADAPETSGAERVAGEYVEKRVAAWLGDSPELILHSYRCNTSFSRYLFEVWKKGEDGDENLSDWLLENRLAWMTDHRGKVIGPRNLELLDLPEGVRQACREARA